MQLLNCDADAEKAQAELDAKSKAFVLRCIAQGAP